MSTGTKDSLIIWDSDNQWVSDYGDILLWRNYDVSEADGIYSIPRLVEKNAEQFRSQYLALIYELGEAKVNRKRVVECLEIRPGFSYWWMTLLTEKCNFSKSPQIDSAIKLMAFEEWLEKKNYKHIKLVSTNAKLAEAIGFLTDKLEVDFKCINIRQQRSKRSFIRRTYDRLPYYLRALAWLARHLIIHWALKGVGIEEWKKTKASTTFISYLFNLDPDSANSGYFESRYWTTLPRLLNEHKIKTNWLHIYVKDAVLKNTTEARNLIKQFNQSHMNNQIHVTLHSFLSVRVVLSLIWDWFQMIRLTKSVGVTLHKNSGAYWPFLKEDYLSSMIGPISMSNMLYLNLFQNAMKNLPCQQRGIYLKENQGWEFGFIHLWRAAGHADGLIGVPHTPSKFWDLRQYFDKRNYDQPSKMCGLPLPDYVGMNGETAKKMYLDGGYLESNLIQVEALRYLYLNKLVKHQSNSVVSETDKMTLLILGDYTKEKTVQQMEMLQKSIQYTSSKIQYVIKPHPACQVIAEDYPELDLVITKSPISVLIDYCSLVYTSNATSAAVDAYCAGKPVVTVLDSKSLNLSPLKGSPGVLFVSSPKELADVLNNISQIKGIEGQGSSYFYLNPKLPMWEDLLVKSDKIKKQINLEKVH